jgi:hypothetical protein
LWPLLGNRFRHATAAELYEKKNIGPLLLNLTIFGYVCCIA